jgi:hypothetical protein
LIRDAAKEAIKQIGKDSSLEESPRLDHDTQGVSGMPEIVGTIFKKIENCDVFLADLTFVGKTEEGKLLSNPNVLLELGYAARCIGWERIICVLNEAYGSADDLIFDVKHRRWPIRYIFESSARSKADAKRTLSHKIRDAVSSVLASEHQAIEDTISVLTIPLMYVLKKYANENGFHQHLPAIEDDDEKVNFGPQWQMHVADRLLELKLAYHTYITDDCEFVIDHGNNGYSGFSWTYKGIVVLKRLGFID